MKFFSSTQNRKDGKHGNIMGTFITQHSLNRFLFRRWRIRSRFALAGPIWGNSSKTTAVCCVYANNFWYFLILSHFTQYTHLRFSIPHFGVFCVFFPFFVSPGPCCCRGNSGVAALSNGGTFDMPSDGAWRSWGSGWSWCPLQKYMKLSELKPFLGFTKKTNHKVKTSPPIFEFWFQCFFLCHEIEANSMVCGPISGVFPWVGLLDVVGVLRCEGNARFCFLVVFLDG